MATSNRDRVGHALELLAGALDAFITTTLQGTHEGRDWTVLLAARDAQRGTSHRIYERGDVQNSLRMITENVTGSLRQDWYPFDEKLSRADKRLAGELRDVRNDWAHTRPISGEDAQRALDTAERLLRSLSSPKAADEVRASRVEVRRQSAEREDRRFTTTTPTVGATGLKPWREVVQPHRDVASTGFAAAEFAANLYDVAHDQATGEYGDPVQFFGRTYLTEGLRDLLSGAVRRVLGERGASPVVNLQTTFGGGKTHSMLSLWHLFSGASLQGLPQEVQDLVARAGAETLPSVRRVAIVGTWLKASEADVKPDGTRVSTMWGELAWQLGGAEGYAYVASADQDRGNPGDALRDLLNAYAPAVILVDEWVAYARQLVDRDDRVGGTFETHFTFAQALTEAAAATPGVLLVVSIPASSDADRDDEVEASGTINDEEVGGQHGVIALRRLQNVVRRVASPWRAASANEAFEIVKQRLFERPDAEALAHIGATARAMVDLYRRHSADFPAEVVDNDYADRIRRSYPVHPELFDRLYEDWSTLDRFQRTRGVLRLMNTLVHALWTSEDASPLIMPGSMPLGVDAVVTELTQYVEDRFKSVISADVEGPQSQPRAVDEANRATLGSRHVTQRLARTIFIGATPTLRTANKGLERRRVFLGTALPGDIPGNFHSALGQLTDRTTYLYAAGSSYWYDTQASMARTARDHADQLHSEDIHVEVVRRLEKERRSDPHGFAAVHLTDDPAQVPESDEVRLAVLPLRHTHHRKAGSDSPAMGAARRVIDNRGGGNRVHRNLIVVLAGDSTRAPELEQAVRDHLGWCYVVEHADSSLDLTAQQKAQAKERSVRADRTASDRLLDTYTWALVPEAVPGAPYTLRAVRADTSTTSVVERVTKKLIAESELSLVQAAPVIRQQISKVSSVWDGGHVSVEQLWELYATYPYLPRLRDRRVLESGVLDTLSSGLAWELDRFAIAENFDQEAQRYVGLHLPGEDPGLLTVTGRTLLVRPEVAIAQRNSESSTSTDVEADTTEGASSETFGSVDGSGATPTGSNTSEHVTALGDLDARATKTRFFGSRTLSSERYAADFSRITGEILAHLSAVPGVQLDVRLEIEATAPRGFTDSSMRTVSENATTLRFDQFGFEER